MPSEFIRTCQSCGHRQKDKPPSQDKELSTSYTERKCKMCKSSDLDYGSWKNTNKNTEYDEEE